MYRLYKGRSITKKKEKTLHLKKENENYCRFSSPYNPKSAF